MVLKDDAVEDMDAEEIDEVEDAGDAGKNEAVDDGCGKEDGLLVIAAEERAGFLSATVMPVSRSVAIACQSPTVCQIKIKMYYDYE